MYSGKAEDRLILFIFYLNQINKWIIRIMPDSSENKFRELEEEIK